MTADLSRLAELAKAATPGPWGFDYEDDWYVFDKQTGNFCFVADHSCELPDQNAAFISACSPDVVLDLLARLQQAEAAVARVTALIDSEAAMAMNLLGCRWFDEADIAAALAPTTEEAS